jgi:hypothetical protein
MASILLRRQLRQNAARFLRRHVSSTAARQYAIADTSKGTGIRSVQDTHIVEDLQGMSAADILSEDGSRNTKMRHFTGGCSLNVGFASGTDETQSILGKELAQPSRIPFLMDMQARSILQRTVC